MGTTRGLPRLPQPAETFEIAFRIRRVASSWPRGTRSSSQIDSSQPGRVAVGSGEHQVHVRKVEPLQHASQWSRYGLPTICSRGPSTHAVMKAVDRPARAFKTSLGGPALPSGQSRTCSTTRNKVTEQTRLKVEAAIAELRLCATAQLGRLPQDGQILSAWSLSTSGTRSCQSCARG